MAYIRIAPDEQATGLLEKVYQTARERAGRIFNILRIQSPQPRVLHASMGLYQATMFGPSPLSRADREMIAVVVSRANDCGY